MSEYYIYNSELYSSDELAHHGVKGMKWGVRRYQNKDGSLTAAGKRQKKKHENKLERINESIFTDRIYARNVDRDDPARDMELSVLSDRVKKHTAQGKRIVDTMKQKGLLSDKTTFDEYVSNYENRVVNDCKKYIKEKYDLKNVTDDDVNYFLGPYIVGAI